jgi:hypothetical protein
MPISITKRKFHPEQEMKTHAYRRIVRLCTIISVVSICFFVLHVQRETPRTPAYLPGVTAPRTAPPVVAEKISDLPEKIRPTAAVRLPESTLVAGEITVVLPIGKGETLSVLLSTAQKNGVLSLRGKTYPGLGFFVTDIGTLHQGAGKFLVYYVNGVSASVGASTYIPKNGDHIEWKLE